MEDKEITTFKWITVGVLVVALMILASYFNDQYTLRKMAQMGLCYGPTVGSAGVYQKCK